MNGNIARFGENLAARFLEQRGARIVGRNVRVGRDEVDLVAAFGRRRVAVEVKTRRGADALDEFTEAKAARAVRAAADLRPPAGRVDLVAVTIEEGGVSVRWVPGAA